LSNVSIIKKMILLLPVIWIWSVAIKNRQETSFKPLQGWVLGEVSFLLESSVIGRVKS
jgi:hypothetical protein